MAPQFSARRPLVPNAGLSKARDTMRDPKCALSLHLPVAKFASTSILSCMSKQGQTLGQTRRTACKIIPLLIMRTMRCRGSIIYNKCAVSRASRRSYHQKQKDITSHAAMLVLLTFDLQNMVSSMHGGSKLLLLLFSAMRAAIFGRVTQRT